MLLSSCGSLSKRKTLSTANWHNKFMIRPHYSSQKGCNCECCLIISSKDFSYKVVTVMEKIKRLLNSQRLKENGWMGVPQWREPGWNMKIHEILVLLSYICLTLS